MGGAPLTGDIENLCHRHYVADVNLILRLIVLSSGTKVFTKLGLGDILIISRTTNVELM